MEPYRLLVFVHVLSAVVALGSNFTYSIWLSRARRNPEHLAYVLRTVQAIDNRVANPAYGLLLLTGLAMIAWGPHAITERWIISSLVLYAVAIVLGIGFYTPALRRQIAAAETSGPESPEYQRAARRGTTVGVLVSVIVLAILFLMVVKPQV